LSTDLVGPRTLKTADVDLVGTNLTLLDAPRRRASQTAADKELI